MALAITAELKAFLSISLHKYKDQAKGSCDIFSSKALTGTLILKFSIAKGVISPILPTAMSSTSISAQRPLMNIGFFEARVVTFFPKLDFNIVCKTDLASV